MRTIQIQNDLYEAVSSKGIDIQNSVKEFLYSLVDNDHSAISKQEANQRVSDAVSRYKNGTGTYLNADEYSDYRTNIADSIKSKYANN